MATIDEVIHRYMQEKEKKRHTLVEENLTEEKIKEGLQKESERRQTALELAGIRAKSAKDRNDLYSIAEERKQAELDWKIERATAKDASAQAEADRKYKQKDKELAQRQAYQTQKVDHWNAQLEEKQFEHDNPVPAKPFMDRIEITDPNSGTKQVIHRGQPAWDEYIRNQSESTAQSAAQSEADKNRSWWQQLRGVHLPIPPKTGTNTPPSSPQVPGATNSMIPPSISLPGTNTGTAPPFAPSQIPGVGNGMTAPPMPARNTVLPGIGRQLVAPPLSPSHDEPGGPYDVPDAVAPVAPQLPPASDFIIPDNPGVVPMPNTPALIKPATVETAPRNRSDRVEGRAYQLPNGKIGTWTKDGWQVE